MNLNQLRFATAVADTGSFSRAAEKCCVTQPTLSNAVAQLEEELGGRLFQRTTRNVAVTPFGTHVLPLIEAVLDSQAELLNGARAFHEPTHKLLRIGLSPLVDVRLLNRLIAPFAECHGDVELFFKQCFLGDMDERLENGTVDLAIVPRGLPRVGRERCRLYSEPLCYLPRGDDGAGGDGEGWCRLGDYPDAPMILTQGCGLSDTIADLFKRQGLVLKPYPGQALSYQVVEEWADLGIGAGILPLSKISPANRSARRILLDNGSEARVTFEAHWVSDAGAPRHVGAFIHHLREVVPSLAAELAA